MYKLHRSVSTTQTCLLHQLCDLIFTAAYCFSNSQVCNDISGVFADQQKTCSIIWMHQQTKDCSEDIRRLRHVSSRKSFEHPQDLQLLSTTLLVSSLLPRLASNHASAFPWHSPDAASASLMHVGIDQTRLASCNIRYSMACSHIPPARWSPQDCAGMSFLAIICLHFDDK